MLTHHGRRAALNAMIDASTDATFVEVPFDGIRIYAIKGSKLRVALTKNGIDMTEVESPMLEVGDMFEVDGFKGASKVTIEWGTSQEKPGR